jgi:hypothetical protein
MLFAGGKQLLDEQLQYCEGEEGTGMKERLTDEEERKIESNT